MPVRIFNLRNVPDDEAAEVCELLDAHDIDFYETPPGMWGISSPGLWSHDAHQAAVARELIDAYQTERAARARAERERQRADGETRSLLDELREHPLRFVVYVGFALVVLYFSTRPFIDFGQ